MAAEGEENEEEKGGRKLRIFAISDLHLEFHKGSNQLFQHLEQKKMLPAADVLILAGDVGCPHPQHCSSADDGEDGGDDSSSSSSRHGDHQSVGSYKKLLRHFRRKYAHVLLVLGNHEYYRTRNYDRDAVVRTMDEICADTGVTLLDRGSVVIEGVEFIGATLWSLIDATAAAQMGDFRREIFKNRLEYIEMFMRDYTWLRGALAQPSRGERGRVVITHHLPTYRLIHERFQSSDANSGWATNVVDEVNMYSVDLWVCGHTHERGECKYGRTEMIANPLGYPGEERQTEVSTRVFVV